ncbi:MAG: hypothetical protein K0S86_5709 [Geminicoccaceae bacterium]|nr:hypothetical protein [Geminicoccaceae bacterium]
MGRATHAIRRMNVPSTKSSRLGTKQSREELVTRAWGVRPRTSRRCAGWRRLTTARWVVAYDIGAAPPTAGLLRYRPGATGGNDRRTPGFEGL